jgi:hypothetical protein
MEDPKPAFPPWIPWAVAACLAVAAACLGELWMVGQVRLELASDQARMSDAARMEAENQLVAERILNAREVRMLREEAAAIGGFRSVRLTPPGGPDASKGAPSGIVFWDPEDPRTVYVHLTGLSAPGGGQVYRLWLHGPHEESEDLGSFADPNAFAAGLRLLEPIQPGVWFTLGLDAKYPNTPGSPVNRLVPIVLASPPLGQSINSR